MSWPDFICIGAQKAGTSWLYEMLAQNPSIWLPPLKEVHYFDRLGANEIVRDRRRQHLLRLADKLDKKKKSKGSQGIGQSDFVRSLAGEDILTEGWYQRIFSHPDSENKISGEITPAYLSLDEAKLNYVAERLTHTKFILIVREPAARYLSQLKMEVARLEGAQGTDEEWRRCIGLIGTNLQRGDYAVNIPSWLEAIGKDRLLICPFSLVRTDPLKLLFQIETFIGAEHFDRYAAADQQVHKTKDLPVPDWVRAEVLEMAEPQKDYLIHTFGQEFYKMTN